MNTERNEGIDEDINIGKIEITKNMLVADKRKDNDFYLLNFKRN